MDGTIKVGAVGEQQLTPELRTSLAAAAPAGGGVTPNTLGAGQTVANVMDYGADPTGAASSDAAFSAAYTDSPRVYVPAGTYKLTSFAPPTRSFTKGDGEGSKIIFANATGTLANLVGLQRVKIQDMQFAFTSGSGTLFVLDNSFRCTFTNVIFQGLHTAVGDSYATKTGHIGVRITGNAGDNLFYDCDFLNLGVGIVTDSIQNAVVGGKFGTCYVGIYGTTFNSRNSSGMALSGYVDFVSPFPGYTLNNILIDTTAAQWWVENCWFEGADKPVQVGATAAGGPSQFGMVNCKVAATTTGLEIQNCRQPFVANVQFSANGSATPTSLSINAAAPEGMAVNLISLVSGDPALGGGSDYPPTVFPVGWTYVGRNNLKAPVNTNLPYGAALRMARPDGAYSNTLQISSTQALQVRAPASNISPAVRELDSGGSALFDVDSVTSGINYLGAVPAIAGQPAKLVARSQGGTPDANTGIALTAKGSGAVQAVSNSLTNSLNDGNGNIVANRTVAPGSGTTVNRPAAPKAGAMWYDTTLSKPIWWNGSVWKDAAGTTV